jgi:hypothetical protein
MIVELLDGVRFELLDAGTQLRQLVLDVLPTRLEGLAVL